jgi:hypothetical protein
MSASARESFGYTRPAFDYGSHFKTAGKLWSNASNFVEARCTIDPKDGIVDVTFPNLPSVLTREGGTQTRSAEIVGRIVLRGHPLHAANACVKY